MNSTGHEGPVTNEVLLVEIRNVRDLLNQHVCADEKRSDDHEERLRKLEESNAVFRYLMGGWNLINTAGIVIAAAFGILPGGKP
jgi:hypothetical protein